MKKYIITAAVLMMLIILPRQANAVPAVPEISGEDLFNTAVTDAAEGGLTLNPTELIKRGWSLLTDEITESSGVLVTMIAASTLSALIHIVNTSFGDSSSGQAAFFACFTLMSAAGLKCFSIAFGYAQEVTEALGGFITKLSPLLMMLLASCGSVTSAAAFHPMMSAAVYVTTIICTKCILPLSCVGAMLSVVSNINPAVQITNFCRIANSISKWLMALTFTLFTGISAIYGFSAPALDAVSAKAVKFAVGSLVPVVGNFLSDTVETVVSGTRLMKNAVGTAGIITVCSICIIPVIKIGALSVIIKLAAAFVEPLTDKRISQMLWQLSSSVTTIFAMVLTTAVLFIIAVSIIMASTGIGA